VANMVGRLWWEVARDNDGHRDYKIHWLVRAATGTIGPAQILGATGLPAVGASWAYGGDNDVWARCVPEAAAKPVLRGEPGLYWVVEQSFTTRPLRRCQTATIEDPLLEPPEIGGTFTKRTEEATKNYDDTLIQNSAKEQIKGALAEREVGAPTIQITQNVAAINLALTSQYMDGINNATLYGIGLHKVRFANYTWARKLYGVCGYYYRETFQLEVDDRTWWPKGLDEGTRYLAPGGDPDKPEDYLVYKDKKGEATTILLDGAGGIAATIAAVGEVHVKHYTPRNLLLLGIPPTLF
jgi:hypothetical protein